jgi:dihydroorotase-like cyclic amidohydrolase
MNKKNTKFKPDFNNIKRGDSKSKIKRTPFEEKRVKDKKKHTEVVVS